MAASEARDKQASDGRTTHQHHHHHHPQQQQQQHLDGGGGITSSSSNTTSASSSSSSSSSASEVNRLARIYKNEHVLSSTTTTMATKVIALIGTWNELAVLQPNPSKENLHTLAKFLLSHTLNIVLSVKWMKYKNEYHALLEQAMKNCMKKYASYPEFQIVCTKLLSLIKGPWAKPEIKHMLSSESIIPTKKEYDFFVCEESAYIISMRLKKLCEDKCGDMALNLTRCYLKCCDWAEEMNLSMCISVNQKKFVFDIYLSLLFQHDGIGEMSNLLKTMEISDGIEMVRRFAGKVTSKLWEHHIHIARFSGTIFLTRCVMLPFDEASHYLSELLEVWSSVYSQERDNEEMIASLRRIMKNALTPAHMYLFMDHLSSRFGVNMRPYSVEVCIQAINSDLNCIERVKTESTADTTRLEAISVRVADGFLRLADQFAENLHVARECVLTAFSIMPTPRTFGKIEEMARAAGYEVLDTGQWSCKFHPPPDTADEVLIHCEHCGDYKSDLQLNEALKQTNTALIEAFKVNNTGLPIELCDDLVVILFGPRYQMLSWSQRWRDLQRLCVMYLHDPVGTKNLITELKFVEIDYTPFMIKREAEEYISGDERIDYVHEELAIGRRVKRPRVLSESSDSDSVEVPSLENSALERSAELTNAALEHSAELTNAALEHSAELTNPDVLQTLKSYRHKTIAADGEMALVAAAQSNQDAPTSDTSADAEYEYDTSSSSQSTNAALSAQKQPPVTLYHSYAAPLPTPHTSSSLTGTNSLSDYSKEATYQSRPKVVKRRKCYDPPEKDPPTPAPEPRPPVHVQPQRYYTTQFGNFQRDAECLKLDRQSPVVATQPPADSGDGGVKEKSVEVTPAYIEEEQSKEVEVHKETQNRAPLENKESTEMAIVEREQAQVALVENECGTTLTEEAPASPETSQNLLEFFKRLYKIRECRIMLTRCDDRKENLASTVVAAASARQRRGRKPRIYVDKGRPKRRAASENVTRAQLAKAFAKYPLDVNTANAVANRRVLRTSNDAGRMEALKRKLLGPSSAKMNPVVVMKRLDDAWLRSLLARVPGVHDTQLFRPAAPDRIVQVVQVAGGRAPTATGVVVQPPAAANAPTSTQVSPHIQRIGQPPRTDKAEETLPAASTATTTTPHAAGKAAAHTYTISKSTAPTGGQQQSTLINILSQQIRPANSTPRRSGPLINIISQASIKPTNTISSGRSTTVTTEATQLNNTTTRIITATSSDQQQFLSQIVSHSNRVKAVVGTSTSEPGRIVQFICKSTDGKLIPVTSFPSNRLLKVGTTTTPNTNQSITVVAAPTTANTTNPQLVPTTADANNTDDVFTKLSTSKPEESSNNASGASETVTVAETLPKFQQAFGKSVVYQTNSVDTNNASTNNTDTTTTSTITPVAVVAEKKKVVPTVVTTTVNMQPLQGSVIYTRQMPVGQTINLIQQNRGQVFRIATTGNPEQISLVKDGVIHSKMSALLAAALQGKPKNEINTATTTVVSSPVEEESIPTTTATRVQIARPSLVQNARIVKPVLQIPANVIRSPQTQQATPALSSTTLEQLREFDMVYKQVKERSSTSTPADASTTSSEPEQSSPQRIAVTYLNQAVAAAKMNNSATTPVVVVSSYATNLQPAASPALSVASQGSSSPCVTPAPTPTTPTTPVLPKVASKSTKSSGGKTVKNPPMHAAKTSPIPKPQQKPQEDEHTTQRIFDILAEYAEQLRNSPDLNNKPAPRRRSNPPTNPSQNSKRKKSSSSKKSTCGSSLSTEVDLEDHRTVGSEDSSCGVVQLSMHDDDQNPTAASTSESNDSTTHVVAPRAQQLILTDATAGAAAGSTHTATRNLIIADSSSVVSEALKMPNTAVLVPGNYIMPVSMVKGGQQIAVVSGGSKILATVPARSGPNMLLFQSFLNQGRKPLCTVATSAGTITGGAVVATTGGATTVKYSTIAPIAGITSHTLAGVTAQPPVILPPPTTTLTLGQPITLKKDPEQQHGVSVGGEQLLLTISQPRDCSSTEPDGIISSQASVKLEMDDSTVMSSSDSSSEKTFVFRKQPTTTPIATPVIAQAVKGEKADLDGTDSIVTLGINNSSFSKVETHSTPKNEERVQSVLVTAGTSNGPMLSHSPPQYKQSDCSNGNDQNKDEFLRNGGKQNDKVQSTVFCVQGKIKKSGSRMDREVQQMCMQRRQAALERELRLQKSLSEECEDLGVDEPSTSDLFPEALLFDANNSPSFDQTSQDNLKRSQLVEKEENKLSLFADDDFIFETSHYDEGNTQLCYEEVVDSRILSNGQGSAPEDTTLLQTCTSMSDVTLSSPISPENFRTTTSPLPPLNKYMHKYTNKKKNEKLVKHVDVVDVGDGVDGVDTWSAEVSSSEDTMGSTEMGKHHISEDTSDGNLLSHNNDLEDDLDDIGSFKVVRINVGKRECSSVHCYAEEEIELDGRGTRRIRRRCTCCNGAEEQVGDTSPSPLPVSRKRAATPHGVVAHKKAFPSKKR